VSVAVLGAGAWGTALAATLNDRGQDTRLWGRGDNVQHMQAERENKSYLPGHHLPPEILVTADLQEAIAGCDLVVLALPSASIRSVCQTIATEVGGALSAQAVVVCASKGLEEQTHLTMDAVIAEVLPKAPVALLSGPTFAVEVAAGLPAAVVVASKDPAAATAVQQALAGERLRAYTTEDVAGVAIGGALKNVMAIAAGCADGLGFGHNARAALITRGLHEMGRLAARMGGNPLTLAGLAGLGDLILTCTGDLSRNRNVGLALARGESLSAVTARLKHVAEGIGTAHTAHALATRLGVDMPITGQVAALVAGTKTARAAVADLLARESGPERG
jgi:glycerol-3-phosphate dehydrogenase (NAD(P)+)